MYKVVDNRRTINDITKVEDLFLIDEYRALNETGQEKAAELFAQGATINKVVDFCKKYRKKERADVLKAQANLNKRFRNRTFEKFNDYTPEFKTALVKAKKYADLLPEIIEDGTNIVFEGHGCVGTGKTHLAYAIANYGLDNGIPVKVVNSTELVNAVSYSSLDVKLKKTLLNIDLLVIDDLGKECGYDWLLFELYGILNHRYENCRPTVITTEDTIADLRRHYKVKTEDGIKDRGKSIFSRICENVVIVNMQGDDYRLKRFEMEG